MLTFKRKLILSKAQQTRVDGWLGDDVIGNDTAPDLPTAKAECEKAYREHSKK